MTSPNVSSNFLVAGLFVSIVFILFPSVSLTVQIISLGIAVSVLGLPHGAIDAYIAWQDGLWRSPIGLAAFTGAYLLMTLLVIGVWMALPVFSLLIFLIISAWHFGTDANAQNSAERWLFGSLVFCLPALFHEVDVANLYETLSGPSARNIVPVTRIWGPVAAIILVSMISIKLSHQPQRRKDIIIILGLIAFAWLLPPLIYFAIYFCALHSPTHFGRVLKMVPGAHRRRAVLQTAVFTMLTLALAGLALPVLPDKLTLEQALIQMVFVGLAALTVPHMVLIDGVCRSKLGEHSSPAT